MQRLDGAAVFRHCAGELTAGSTTGKCAARWTVLTAARIRVILAMKARLSWSESAIAGKMRVSTAINTRVLPIISPRQVRTCEHLLCLLKVEARSSNVFSRLRLHI